MPRGDIALRLALMIPAGLLSPAGAAASEATETPQPFDHWPLVFTIILLLILLVYLFITLSRRRRAEKELTAIFDNSLTGIISLKGGRIFRKINARAAAILGYTPEEMLGKSIRDVHLSEKTYRYFGKKHYLRLANSALTQVEYRLRRKDGSPVWCNLSGKAISPPDLDKGVVWILEDISKYKKQEKELAAFNKRLETLVKERTQALREKAVELENANLRLKDLDKMKSAFLASVSHELRTPMTSIFGFARLIRRDCEQVLPSDTTDNSKVGKLTRRIKENLDIIEQEGKRLTRLINNVLDLSRIESGRVQWRDKPLNVSDVVADTLEGLKKDHRKEPAVEIRVEMAQGLSMTKADPERLGQVLRNLLDNALAYTSEGLITIRADMAENNRVRFQIKDTGTGIPKSELETLFDSFDPKSGQDTLLDKAKGTGLGLAVSQRIVARYGGVITVDSAPGRGSTFTFTMPATDESPAPAPRKVPATPIQADPKQGSPLILVVEDDPGVRLYLEEFFRDLGYSVILAESGEQALGAARATRPSLVTMDISLPGMDGRAAINAFRSDPELSTLPIVVITAQAGDRFSGEDAILAKPIDEDRLKAEVSRLLGQPSQWENALFLHRPGDIPSQDTLSLVGGPTQTVEPCPAPEIWKRIQEGFQGLVFIPISLAWELEIERIKGLPGVRVRVLDENGS